MPTNSRVLRVAPAKIWEVLADGWLYPLFVVGASRMRKVDASWPSVGACLHHSFGVWPLLIDDTTEVLASKPDGLLRLRARGWPAGEAEVSLALEPHAQGTKVVMSEDIVTGPGRLMPKPVRAAPTLWRNTETLRRLAFVAERR